MTEVLEHLDDINRMSFKRLEEASLDTQERPGHLTNAGFSIRCMVGEPLTTAPLRMNGEMHMREGKPHGSLRQCGTNR
jgi:hypothetical protein